MTIEDQPRITMDLSQPSTRSSFSTNEAPELIPETSGSEDQLSQENKNNEKLEYNMDSSKSASQDHIMEPVDNDRNESNQTNTNYSSLSVSNILDGTNVKNNIILHGIQIMSQKKENISNKDTPLMENGRTVKSFSPLLRQSIAATGSILVTLTAGLTSGYSAILLPQLHEIDSPIQIGQESESWIASMAALPMSIGCIISGYMMERYGRKNSHLMLCAPFVIGWLVLATSTTLTSMLIGRFLTGLCVGLLGPLGPVYIAEITDPKYRGFFLAAVSLAIAVGIFIAHLIGTFLYWKTTALICAFFPCICYLIISLVPESPSWLISKGRIEEGIEAFHWLRGHDDNASAELKGLIQQREENKDSDRVTSLKEKLENLRRPEVYKPLWIMIIYFITAQFSGVNAVAFYSVKILKSTLGDGLDEYVAMILIDSVRIVMSVVACVLLRHYSRRSLSFLSGILTASSLLALALFLFVSSRYESEANLSWIPLLLMVSYICAISIGIVPLPWVMCGEIFPVSARGVGSGISSAVAFASFFTVVKTSPKLFADFGEAGAYLAYGSVAFVGTGILFFLLPETKGKSLKEIEEGFLTGSYEVGNKNVCKAA